MFLLLTTALAAQGDWKLAGVYDATAAAWAPGLEEGYTWRPHAGMSASCGPAKSPDGLGVFEAEAVGSRLTPVLAVVLRGEGRLGPDDVRVSLGRGKPEILLQPMVEPRHLAITVQGESGTERVAQLVRTQLETETCMEHKTGRAWTGHDATRVRQAFLLDPPAGSDRSRKFFGGQTDPVPGLIGPPDACLRITGDNALRADAQGRGEGSLTLVPTDVWGASLRRCAENEVGGNVLADAPQWLPLRSGDDSGPLYVQPKRWASLEVDLTLAGTGETDEERARVSLTYGDAALMADRALFVPTDTVPGMIDLLAVVPEVYPATGPEGDRDRYTVLLIPDWQLVEGLRRLEKDAPDKPRGTTAEKLADGVSTVLSNPELLLVQVAPAGRTGDWANLATGMDSTIGQPWGYTVGSLDGRSHIVLPLRTPPTWDQTLRAQRGDVHAALLAGMVALFAGLLLGVRRLQDVLNPTPEERAHYWPGLESVNVHDNANNDAIEKEEGK